MKRKQARKGGSGSGGSEGGGAGRETTVPTAEDASMGVKTKYGRGEMATTSNLSVSTTFKHACAPHPDPITTTRGCRVTHTVMRGCGDLHTPTHTYAHTEAQTFEEH